MARQSTSVIMVGVVCYNGGCGIHVLRCLIGELARAVDKRLQFISNEMLPKTVRYTSRELQ